MPVIATHELTPESLLGNAKQIYNALDCAVTFEVHEALQRLTNRDPIAYDFERALQAPALEMMLRGWAVDQYARRQGIEELGKKLDYLHDILDRYAHAIWDGPLNPASRKQMLQFFYGVDTSGNSIAEQRPHMRLSPMWTSKKGVRKLSMDRETLEKLQQYFHAMPIIAVIMAIRELTKQKEMLETEVDPDGRMRTSYNIAGTETGRWCLSGDHEVLTRAGWTTFETWDGHTPIACWSPNGIIQFMNCKKVVQENTRNLLSIENTRYSLLCTREHKLPGFSSKKNFFTTYAGDCKTIHRAPLAGNLVDDFLPEKQTRISMMIQADGSIINAKTIRFHFKKERKILRCEKLLLDADLDYRITKPEDGSTYIYLKDPPTWAFASKELGPWILQHNPKTVIDEIQHWDGDIDRNGATVYYTSVKENAEWIKTIAHLAGNFASLRVKRTADAKWATAYRVYIGVDSTTRVYAAQYKNTTEAPSHVYCATTPTGFFLVRHKGQIQVTGNSSSSNAWGTGGNLQNINPRLRYIFVAEEGWKLCGIDLEQAESREVGFLLGILFDDWTYLDACEQGDLHTTTARLIWPTLRWPGSPKGDRALADEIFYRHYSYRDMSKRGGHGTTYYGTPFTMARHLKVPVALMEDFQEKFLRQAYPAIPKWHLWTAAELQTTQRIVTPFGRERQFFGRPNDDTTLREAIAYSPQSSTAERTNLGLWRIWKYMSGKERGQDQVLVLHQNHDAVYFLYREEAEERVIPEALRHMEIEVRQNGRSLIVPGEAQVGWNWGKHHDERHPTPRWQDKNGVWHENRFNPDGLKKWKGKDPRKRTSLMDRPL